MAKLLNGCLTMAVRIFIGAIILLVALMLIFPPDLDAYRPLIFSTDRADDIAYALLINKAKKGTVPDFDKTDWALDIKDYLNDYSKAAINPKGQIEDTKGNPYELIRHGHNVDIFCYAMGGGAKQVNLDTGAITQGDTTFSQGVRALLFQGRHPRGGGKYFEQNESILLHPKRLTFDQGKCLCTVPNDWTKQEIEGSQVSIVNPDKTKWFEIRITKSAVPQDIDEPFLKPMTSRLTAKGALMGMVKREAVYSVGDFSIEASQAVPEGFVIYRMNVFEANGNTYALYTSKLNAKPWEDGELNTIVKSFAFIGTPQIPH